MCYFWALVPYYNFENNIQYKMSYRYKIYITIVIILWPIFGVVSTIQVSSALSNFPLTQWVLNILNVILILIFNVSAVLECYTKRYFWLHFLNKIKELDRIMDIYKTKNLIYIYEITFGMIICFSLFFYEAFALCPQVSCVSLIINRTMYMPVMLSTYLIGNFAFVLKNKMEFVNNSLLSTNYSKYDRIMKIYCDLNKSIASYNLLFMWRIFLIILVCLSHILSCINFLILYAAFSYKVVTVEMLISILCQTGIWVVSIFIF